MREGLRMSQNISTNPVPLRKRIERFAGRVGLRLIVSPLRALPWPAARNLGKIMGLVLMRIVPRYRRVALKNLALIYSDISLQERERMSCAVFKHFGEMAAEFVKLPRMSLSEVDSLVTVDGEENLKAALAIGKGTLLITGHFGNWEFMARWLASHGYNLNVVTRDARDPGATKLLEETRQGSGAKVLYRGNSARAVLQCLKKNEIVALLPDQNAADIIVPFLGQQTGTIDGPAIVHLKTGSPLLFSWCIRTDDDRFHIVFEPPETIPSTGNRAEDILKVMSLINARLESRIREHPTQWLWFHNRWKASPGIFPDGDWHARELKMPMNKLNAGELKP